MKYRVSAAIVAALITSVAGAQETYPSRALTITVPNPPGGMNQITAQPLSAVIEKLTKQPAPVINRPGGTAAAGTAYVAAQKPDGYHLLVTTPNIYLVVEKNKAQNIDSPYKLEQIQPIALTSADPLILSVHTDSTWKSVKELVAEAKAKDGQLVFSSSGPYGVTHVPFAMFLNAYGLKMRHVPTTGGGPAVTQLLGNHVHATSQGLAAVSPHIKGGKLRPLASFGAKRSGSIPDVPTFKELGQDMEAYLWVGLFTTAGVPEPTLKAMRDLVRRAMTDPLYQQAMQKADIEIDYRDTPDFIKFFQADHKRLGPVAAALAKEEKK
jgi:tripartite-type tricarboxylate transporter receptor subunit TctC